MGDFPGIAIIGVPRSGTTLVRRILDAHPRIACPAETCVLTACARFLHAERVADGASFGVLSGLAFAGFEEAEILDRLRELAVSFHREHAERQGKARWAEKTAVDVFHLDAIERLFGDRLRYICLVRHGLDVACSLRDLCDRGQTYLSEIHEWIQREPRPLEAFARLWVDRTEAIRAFVARRPDHAILIRYEDLVDDPEATIRRMLAAIEEPWDDELIARAFRSREDLGWGDWKTYRKDSIDAGSVGRWGNLTPNTVRELAAICNDTLRACGYPEVAVQDASDDESEARRRYQLALMIQGLKPKE